jgi:CxxC motif-containing protein (DUF1111 family)
VKRPAVLRGYGLIALVAVAPTFAAQPMAGPALPPAEQVELGRYLFTRVWEPALAGPDSGDGLGPLFNARSCAECHHQAGLGGAGDNRNNVQFLRPAYTDTTPRAVAFGDSSRFGAMPPRRRPPPAVMLHRYGVRSPYSAWRATQLAQVDRADSQTVLEIPLIPGQSSERITKCEPPLAPSIGQQIDRYLHQAARFDGLMLSTLDGLRLRLDPLPGPIAGYPEYSVTRCGCRYNYVPQPYYGPPRFFEVNTPPLFGLGLVERITRADVEAIARSQCSDVRGNVPLLADGRLGRFGWKGQHATLRDFCDQACAVELGISTPTTLQAAPPKLHPADDYESASPYWRAVRANPDISFGGVEALAAYVASLPAPREVLDPNLPVLAETAAARAELGRKLGIANPADVRFGRTWFNEIGCGTCHKPDVGSVRSVFSDFLLHDVGTQSDGDYFSPEPQRSGFRGPAEFRTPPLWGVADSAPYLHDGSADTLEEAILAHDGQAALSKRLYRDRISAERRRQILAFLESLRAPLP